MDRQYDVNLQCGATRFRVNEIVAILKELLKQVGELVRDNLFISLSLLWVKYSVFRLVFVHHCTSSNATSSIPTFLRSISRDLFSYVGK